MAVRHKQSKQGKKKDHKTQETLASDVEAKQNQIQA
jgi:hypothetical protein